MNEINIILQQLRNNPDDVIYFMKKYPEIAMSPRSLLKGGVRMGINCLDNVVPSFRVELMERIALLQYRLETK